MKYGLIVAVLTLFLGGYWLVFATVLKNPAPPPSPLPTPIVITQAPVSPTPGAVLGITTTITPPTPKPTPDLRQLLGTNTNTISASVPTGETRQTSLTLINQSTQPVMWYIKLKEPQSANYPLAINGKNEVTGTLNENSTTTVSVNLRDTSPKPTFTDTFDVVFQTPQQIVARTTVQVTVQSPYTKNLTINSKADTYDSIAFISQGFYPLWIVNKHDSDLNWTAVVDTGKLSLGFTNGTTARYTRTYVPLQFTSTNRDGLHDATITVTYFDKNNTEVTKHRLFLTITD